MDIREALEQVVQDRAAFLRCMVIAEHPECAKWAHRGFDSGFVAQKLGLTSPKRTRVRDWARVRKAFAVLRDGNGEGEEYPTDVAEAPQNGTQGQARPNGAPTRTDEYQGDTWTATGKTTARIHTLDELMAFFDVDATEWQVKEWRANKWEVGAKNRNGDIEVTPLYQVKALFERRKAFIAVREEIAAMVEDAKKYAPTYPPIARVKPDSEQFLLEITIPDLHNGKLAWREETGADYDLQISVDAFRTALEELLRKTAVYPVERVLLVLGNDLLHIDNNNNTTTKGTPQDADSRYSKIFRETRKMCVWAIERCVQVAPVDVLMMSGNHDEQSVFCLGEVLLAWFHNCTDVVVDNAPISKKYREYGKVLLGFLHGDKIKPDKLPLLMAQDMKGAWGRTFFREFHTGHIHTFKGNEFAGVIVRSMDALCPSDKWHYDNGYDHNMRRAEAFVWSKTTGLVGTAVHTIVPEEGEE